MVHKYVSVGTVLWTWSLLQIAQAAVSRWEVLFQLVTPRHPHTSPSVLPSCRHKFGVKPYQSKNRVNYKLYELPLYWSLCRDRAAILFWLKVIFIFYAKASIVFKCKWICVVWVSVWLRSNWNKRKSLEVEISAFSWGTTGKERNYVE